MNGRIVNPDQYRRMPWRNGGGETVEIARFPPDADLDGFGWRVSMATVGTDGPFSIFHGIDRTLCVLSGNGISLAFGSDKSLILDKDAAPFSFPGDVPVIARLVDGPITDLNVMTRRAGWRHAVQRHHLRTDEILVLDTPAAHAIVFCQAGAIGVGGAMDPSHLECGAALLIEDSTRECKLRASATTTAFVILIDHANA
jgi:environmental stress-induced protein Ves